MAENNLQAKTDFTDPQILSIDFVENFNKNLKSLTTMLGVERKIPMSVGAVIKTYKNTVTLADNKSVGAGEDIPLSKVSRTVNKTYELEWNKFRKAVPIELVQQVGFDNAVSFTDEKLLREIQKDIRDNLFKFLTTGTGVATGANLQITMADAWAKVVSAFPEDEVDVIAFLNPEDVAKHLGTAQLSTQTSFGMTYMSGFLNTKVAITHPGIPKGKIYATAAQNLVLAYAQLTGDIKKAFKDIVSDTTGIIGVMHDTNTINLTSQTIAVLATKLYAEDVSGVIVGSITGA